MISILLFSILNAIFAQPVSIDKSSDSKEIENEDTQIVNNQIYKQQVLQNLNNMDGYFTKNMGQIENDSVEFYIPGGGVWFMDDGVCFELREEIENGGQGSQLRGQGGVREIDFDSIGKYDVPEPVSYKRMVLKQEFVGANEVKPLGREKLSWYSNFFYGNISSNWRTSVPNYREVYYENIYDNIDLRYYSNKNGLKYDFIVHPGGVPKDIKLKIDGATGLINKNEKNLKIKTEVGEIVDSNLLIYQKNRNELNYINGRFEILNSSTYGFRLLEDYDKSVDLIIDPLIFSTFIGGELSEYGWGIDVDSNKNAYITGVTNSMNFPNTTGSYDNSSNKFPDTFILKLNPNGSDLIYSTFIGGNNSEFGEEVKVDLDFNVYLTGRTNSTDFPINYNAYDSIQNGDFDVFALKLNSTGSSIIYSTFIGGKNYDHGLDIAIDSNNNLYITGLTESYDFPNTPSSFDASHNGGVVDIFIIKLNATGSSISYSTYFGGGNYEIGRGISVDILGNVYVAGWTNSSNFTTSTNAYDTTYNGGDSWGDIFILKFNSNGSSLIYSTYIGGSDDEFADEIEVDSNYNAIIGGETWSSNFPTTQGAYDRIHSGSGDIIIAKINPNGTALLYSTFIGGGNRDTCQGIALDLYDNVYVTGETQSPNFPTTNDAFDKLYNGTPDAFLSIIDPFGKSLIYSTFIGGSNEDGAVGIAIDLINNIYITGITCSADFPISNNTFDNTYDGHDIFVIKFNKIIDINFPQVLDLSLSKSFLLRNESVFLYSNATDIEDLEKNLTQYFQYRDPNDLYWNSTNFSKPVYNNSRWEVKFTPPYNSPLGTYDFRVRCNDSGGLFSPWFYLYDQLTVKKNVTGQEPFSEEQIRQNLTVHINLDKNKYYLVENITGKIKIINNNSINVYTVFPDDYGTNITIEPNILFEINETKIGKRYYSWDAKILKITAKSKLVFNFTLDGFNVTENWTFNQFKLPLGNYSINASLRFFARKNISFNFNTNTKHFKIINKTIKFQNLTIDLNLSKYVFYINESINGSITILNTNTFDVILEDNIFHQRFGGHNLELYSIETGNKFGAVIKDLTHPIKIKAQSTLIINFSLKQVFKQPMNSKELSYSNLEIGNYSMFAFFYYNNLTELTVPIIFYSNEEYFRVIANESEPGLHPEPTPPPIASGKGTSSSFIINAALGIIIVMLIITTTFITTTEVGKYSFFKGFIIPLYTKSRRKKMDKNYGYKKGLVLGYILGNPGENYNSIKNVLNMNNGALTYYLRILEREGTIKSERDGMYKRFYPAKANITREVLELSDVQKNIYQTIKEHLGITQKEIAEQLGMAQQTVNYHIQLMEQARIIRLDREGKRSKCFIIQEVL
jgi:DNA-binding MarR family transcriptional regulator